VEAPTTGTISYAGGGAPLVGADIEVDSIVGLSTPSNADTPITCAACDLNFTTGVNTGGWDFAGPGSITIVGGVPAAGIGAGSLLLNGTFNSASVFDVGGGTFNFKITGASFFDTKHPDLLAYFGLPDVGYNGALNISFSTISSMGSSFTSDQIFSGDIVNQPVPIPAAVWLFASGLLGLMGIAKKKAA
jgi:hypothetical protein